MTTEPKFIVIECPHCGSEIRQVSGRWLRERRSVAGVSLREMARQVGFSAPYLSDIERGNRKPPETVVATYDALRRSGRTKLVYNKATRTIDEVRVQALHK